MRKIAVKDSNIIFDELISAEIIIKGIAFEKLEQLMKINKRLPGLECQKRLKVWKKSI